jgi:hypothetical protein
MAAELPSGGGLDPRPAMRDFRLLPEFAYNGEKVASLGGYRAQLP